MNSIFETSKDFEAVLTAIEKVAEQKSFRVQHIHPVSKILNEKGFEFEDYAIVELCNPAFAYKVLSINKNYGVLMPCKILVYKNNNKVYLSIPKPTELVEKFEMNELKLIAEEVEIIIKEIVNEVIK